MFPHFDLEDEGVLRRLKEDEAEYKMIANMNKKKDEYVPPCKGKKHDWTDWGISQNVVHLYWYAHRWCKRCGKTHRQKLEEPKDEEE